MSICHTIIESEIDGLTLVAENGYLAGIYFEDHWTGVNRANFGARVEVASEPILAQTAVELGEYFAGQRTSFDMPLVSHGSAFEESVWSILKTIPFGARITYGDIAKALGGPGYSQQVGQAVGHNPI